MMHHRADVHAPYDYQNFVDGYVNGLDMNSGMMRQAIGRPGRVGESYAILLYMYSDTF